MKTKVIKWKDLKIGDQFLDGSIVLDIEDWKMQRCFELKLKDNEPLVVSEDHMMMLKVFDNNNNVINSSFEHSRIQREIIAADSDIWISALDAYDSFQSGCKIVNEWDEEIEYVKEFDNGEEKRVRCITTDVGHYVINGICNHNTARKLFYCMSDTMVVEDCGGPHIDALHCKMPEGHVCRKCANMTKGGETIKPGDLVGGLVSTNMSEALTQLSMKNMHCGSDQVKAQQHSATIIMNTLDAFGTSPIIQGAVKLKTTEERRQYIYESLKELYHSAGIKQDDFNIMMVAKKLTSYKRSDEGTRPVRDDECCDIISTSVIGNKNNIFKYAELKTGYGMLTRPTKQEIEKDAANGLMI